MRSASVQLLFIDDDSEVIQQFEELLPAAFRAAELNVQIEFAPSFEAGSERLSRFRYDLVVCDVYSGDANDEIGRRDVGTGVVARIREAGFCPIVLTSAGPPPDGFCASEFVRFASKAGGIDPIVGEVRGLLDTQVPQIARRLHQDLNDAGNSYLWSFLETKWEQLRRTGLTDGDVLERILRKRAAVALARLDEHGEETAAVEGAEYYLCPPIAGESLRLGEVLMRRSDRSFLVVLTPHCLLVKQQGDAKPKADHLTLARTVAAEETIRTDGQKCGTDGQLRQLTLSPPKIGKPRGRYWFLPEFLDIPSLYCDFLQIESVPMSRVDSEFERFAQLDSPWAEALQSQFLAFYASVGLPELSPGSRGQLRDVDKSES